MLANSPSPIRPCHIQPGSFDPNIRSSSLMHSMTMHEEIPPVADRNTFLPKMHQRVANVYSNVTAVTGIHHSPVNETLISPNPDFFDLLVIASRYWLNVMHRRRGARMSAQIIAKVFQHTLFQVLAVV
jgi:hypothetical protein